MSWIDKILPSGVRSEGVNKRSSVPEGLWKKCVKCEAVLYRPDVERNDDVCPKCDHHMRVGARRRLDIFLDPEGREEILTDIEPVDRLKFKDKKRYRDRLSAAQKSTG
jgi:acetyl-CoA carboxylase carboxyl transferase subunit beta